MSLVTVLEGTPSVNVPFNAKNFCSTNSWFKQCWQVHKCLNTVRIKSLLVKLLRIMRKGWGSHTKTTTNDTKWPLEHIDSLQVIRKQVFLSLNGHCIKGLSKMAIALRVSPNDHEAQCMPDHIRHHWGGGGRDCEGQIMSPPPVAGEAGSVSGLSRDLSGEGLILQGKL